MASLLGCLCSKKWSLKSSQEQEKACKLINELIFLLKNNLGSQSSSKSQGNGLGIEVEAGVVSWEVGVVEEIAGVANTKAGWEAKKVDLAMVTRDSPEIPMVIKARLVGPGLLSVNGNVFKMVKILKALFVSYSDIFSKDDIGPWDHQSYQT